MSVIYAAICAKHKSTLEHSCRLDAVENLRVEAEPCEECIKEANTDGYERGRKDGYERALEYYRGVGKAEGG